MKNRLLSVGVIVSAILAMGGCTNNPPQSDEVATSSEVVSNLCEGGQAQSPVDIATPQAAKLQPIDFSYQVGAVARDGDVITVKDGGGMALNVGEEKPKMFDLKQLSVSAPAQHAREGRHAPVELDLLHESADGSMAMLGLLMLPGEENAAIGALLKALGEGGPGEVDISGLLPTKLGYFAYKGSLTTAPCTEGVKWVVMQYPLEASSEQIQQLQNIEARPPRDLQPLNDRTVYGSIAGR